MTRATGCCLAVYQTLIHTTKVVNQLGGGLCE